MPEAKRQLAAIMFTDIVGYTALMGKDSDKALELVRISKDIQKPLVEKHNGKWLKEMGDGAMAQFSTALDAVNCSIEIQKTARGELDAKLRIGIHLGDVTVEEDDVYGDGVNVAARLESIADPGGIYVSDAIEKAIKGQSDVQAKYLGEIKLKNVAYGVRTYALQGVGLPVPDVKGEKELSGRFWAELAGSWKNKLTFFLTILATALISIIGSWTYWNNSTKANEQQVKRFSILIPDNSEIDLIGEATVGVGRRVLDINDTGDRLVYTGNYEGRPHIFVRDINDFKARVIPQTAGAYSPVLSSEGNEVAYFVGNSLRKIRIQDGAPVTLAEATNPMDIIWMQDDLYFSAEEGNNIFKLSEFPKEFSVNGQGNFISLSKVPGQNYFLVSSPDSIGVLDLNSRQFRSLALMGSSPKFSPTGHIIFVRGTSLLAVEFDEKSIELKSEPREIIAGIRTETYGNAQYDLSYQGTLVYIEGDNTRLGNLSWVNRGGELKKLDFPMENFGTFKLSPDMSKIAAPIYGVSSDIWIYDLNTIRKERVTNGGFNHHPVWIENNTLMFGRDGNIYMMKTDEGMNPELFMKDAVPHSATPDGSKLVIVMELDLYVVDMNNLEKIRVLNTPEVFEGHGSISPNGQLIAYTTDESKAFHVNLKRVEEGGKVVQISRKEGSEEPRWTADGRSIIYRSGQDWMEVKIISEDDLTVSDPVRIITGDFVNIAGFSFDIAEDGSQLLVSKGTDIKTSFEIKVVENWFVELVQKGTDSN